jgi:ribosomal protein S18 acetylase RimI-like enzyme
MGWRSTSIRRSWPLPVEVARVQGENVAPFFKTHEREALKTFYNFSVIWHEQSYEFAAVEDGVTLGAATLRVAASLGHVDRLVVAPDARRRGIGRQLLDAMADVANYYNCHKMTALVPHNREAQKFFEACGYREEAVLPQHTFKLDMAVLRKFLL